MLHVGLIFYIFLKKNTANLKGHVSGSLEVIDTIR